MIAAQGDIDARTLHEKGLLASNALRVYEHVERIRPNREVRRCRGRPAVVCSIWRPSSRSFSSPKCDLTGRTRGTYGYRWDLAENVFPDSFSQASPV